jgi:hypothetical protein
MARTRPDAASSALDGTQPRFTHVPPTSPPEQTATLSPFDTACRAAPCPPTPHPTITRSKSVSSMRRSVLRATAWGAGLSTPGSCSAVAVTAIKGRTRTIFDVVHALAQPDAARDAPGIVEGRGHKHVSLPIPSDQVISK